MPDDTDRDSWVAKTTTLLWEHISEFGYEAQNCRDLAEKLFDLPMPTAPGATPQRQRVATWLIELQEPKASNLTTPQAVPVLDWGRLLVPSRTARGILNIATVTLLRYRESGVFSPAVEHKNGQRVDTLVYWLSDLLFVVAMDRHFRKPGPGMRRFPWAEYG